MAWWPCSLSSPTDTALPPPPWHRAVVPVMHHALSDRTAFLLAWNVLPILLLTWFFICQILAQDLLSLGSRCRPAGWVRFFVRSALSQDHVGASQGALLALIIHLAAGRFVSLPLAGPCTSQEQASVPLAHLSLPSRASAVRCRKDSSLMVISH